MKIRDIAIHAFKGLEDVSLTGCGSINALIGKNNSGKSSILHAIDMTGLALSRGQWSAFQPKLEVKDMLSSIGTFEVEITFEDGSRQKVTSSPGYGPLFNDQPSDNQKFTSVLIFPDTGSGLMRRQHQTPFWVMQMLENRQYSELNSLEILYALKFYSLRSERAFTPETYQTLKDQIIQYFPELEDVESDRTEQDVSTLTYTEYGRKLDILYSGTGLRHFLDVLLKTTISNANVVLLDEPEMGLHADLQRRFMDYLRQLSEEKGIQFFLATQSQVLLNYADAVTFYRVTNTLGHREVVSVPNEAVHTIMGDLGLRPSDVFNQDLCLLVEGASEIVFFEHIIRVLYKEEFDRVAIGIQQYGGGAAEGIIRGSISVSNITPAQKYVLWTHDRDAPPADQPAHNATQFKNAIEASGFKCHIWGKREIEFYYPEAVHVQAQQGDEVREGKTRAILHGDQTVKYRNMAQDGGVCVPTGSYLRKLLREHLTLKDQLDQEIRDLIADILVLWKNEIYPV